MIKITDSNELKSIGQDNIFIGELPEMRNSTVQFEGSRNIFVCEKGVRLVNSTIKFCGDDSVVFLCENGNDYLLNLTAHGKSAVFIGRNNYFNGALNAITSERKHIFIGCDGLFSFGIWMRVADPHLIYDVQTKQRINPSKSIFIGDHVWVGQSAMILKGSQIHSGSIIGAMSVVSGKRIPSNTSWAGNPARRKGNPIFWAKPCVHRWTKEQTDNSQVYKGNNFIYRQNKHDYIPFDEIDEKLSSLPDAQAKYEYLKAFAQPSGQNRFASESDFSVKEAAHPIKKFFSSKK